MSTNQASSSIKEIMDEGCNYLYIMKALIKMNTPIFPSPRTTGTSARFKQAISHKLKYLLASVLILAFSTGNAQSWHFGPKVDLNLSGIDGNGMSSSHQAGLQIGGFAQKQLSKKWSIQPELLYNMTNVKQDDDFSTYYLNARSSTKKSVQLNYVSIPVLIRYELSSKFSLLAGPEYSYMFNTNENMLKYEAKSFKKNDVSLNLGAQFNIGNFGLYARYNRGLSDINDIDDRYDWKLTHIQVGFAVKVK